MKNKYFVIFNKTMKKYVNNSEKVNEKENNKVKKRFSQYELYNKLFTIHLKETSKEDKGISEAQISKWVNGKEAIPNLILSHVFHDTMECRCHYSRTFEKYVDEINVFKSMEAEKKLAEEMCQLKMDWGIDLFLVIQDNNLWDILADILATALICDYALHTVDLEIGLKQYLLEMVKFCKGKNTAFKTPFLLSALFQTNHSLLWYTFNKLEKDLGAKWASLIKKYVNSEHSQTFEEINLNEINLLNYARIHSCLNNKTEMDELELCCVIINYPGSSNTLKQLKNVLYKHGYNDYENWRKLLLQNAKELNETSINYFTSD